MTPPPTSSSPSSPGSSGRPWPGSTASTTGPIWRMGGLSSASAPAGPPRPRRWRSCAGIFTPSADRRRSRRAARCAAPAECHKAARPGGRALYTFPLRNLPPHPSGPRPDTFPPGGRLRTAARAAPTANLGAVSFFVGAGHWPARRGSSAIPEPTLIRLASLGTFPLEGGRLCGRGKSLSPLSRCARHLPLIRGVVPSSTGFKDTFRVWVREALGPPADPWKQGGPVCRPYGFARVHSKH